MQRARPPPAAASAPRLLLRTRANCQVRPGQWPLRGQHLQNSKPRGQAWAQVPAPAPLSQACQASTVGPPSRPSSSVHSTSGTCVGRWMHMCAGYAGHVCVNSRRASRFLALLARAVPITRAWSGAQGQPRRRPHRQTRRLGESSGGGRKKELSTGAGGVSK